MNSSSTGICIRTHPQNRPPIPTSQVVLDRSRSQGIYELGIFSRQTRRTGHGLGPGFDFAGNLDFAGNRGSPIEFGRTTNLVLCVPRLIIRWCPCRRITQSSSPQVTRPPLQVSEMISVSDLRDWACPFGLVDLDRELLYCAAQRAFSAASSPLDIAVCVAHPPAAATRQQVCAKRERRSDRASASRVVGFHEWR